VLTDQRLLVAYDPETGDTLWKGRISPGMYRPSLVAGDGKIYALNQHGVVSVVDAEGSEFRMLGESPMGESAYGATPAIAGGCLLVRTQNHLFCVEDRKPSTEGSAAAG
jgi:outer membrane protein assembly factor BamB